MSEELAGIQVHVAAVESKLGVGTARRRRIRFSLQALFWLLTLVAMVSFTTVQHRQAARLQTENAKLKAQNATLQAKCDALMFNMADMEADYNSIQKRLMQQATPKRSSPFILP